MAGSMASLGCLLAAWRWWRCFWSFLCGSCSGRLMVSLRIFCPSWRSLPRRMRSNSTRIWISIVGWRRVQRMVLHDFVEKAHADGAHLFWNPDTECCGGRGVVDGDAGVPGGMGGAGRRQVDGSAGVAGNITRAGDVNIGGRTAAGGGTKMKRHFSLVVLFCCHSLLAGPLLAEGVGWEDLSPKEQRLLKAVEPNWDALPEEKQKLLRKGANRWHKMTPEQRAKAKKNLARWKLLSEGEKKQLTNKYELFRKLSPEQKRKVRQRREWFKNLPPEKKRKLRQRWQKLKHDPQAEQKIKRWLDRQP
ncbi:hypothetical protein DJ030_05360 [bacterium endosymbiont of Escarpia laminata]|nr:MAG: hypothetical protein DJ030_05360 [bacterium endosymbiont of Escarpia laminata]